MLPTEAVAILETPPQERSESQRLALARHYFLERATRVDDPFAGLADDTIVRSTRIVEYRGTVAWLRKQIGQSLSPGRRNAGDGNFIDIVQGDVVVIEGD